jgi:multiple antibiotic resistance protein
MSFVDLTLQAIVSLVLLVDPFIRAVFFRMLTENEPERRRAYVLKLMTTIGILLGGSAVVGKELLEAIGIDLDAFGIVGGVVLVLMGFEMLLGGEPSRAQGGEAARDGVFAALIAVAVTVALIPVGHLYLVNRMNFSAQTMSLMTKFGGLFVATIGTQLILAGIKAYFGI